MCTAAAYLTKDFYFGRNLDYEHGYGEAVTVTPRRYRFALRSGAEFRTRYAMIGMACVAGDYPLYYDAVNEAGLCIAGLNFVGNAVYHPAAAGKENLAQFELIPWLLGQCATVAEARALLARLNITDVPFAPEMPTAQLHWLLADRDACLTVESTKDGLHVYENPAGVLTNNPPFPQQLEALSHYAHLSAKPPVNHFLDALPYSTFSRGLGGLGLPGDLSSQSRFIRAAFVRLNSRSGSGEAESVSQFFHILRSVEQQRGCCELPSGDCELTIYTSCCNARTGVYYYTTYDGAGIAAVDLHRAPLDGETLAVYPLLAPEIQFVN